MFAAAAIVLSRISIFWQPRGGKYCTLMAAPCSQQRAEGQLACFEAGGNSRQRVQRLGTLAQPYRRIYRTVATPLRLGLLLSRRIRTANQASRINDTMAGRGRRIFPADRRSFDGDAGEGDSRAVPFPDPNLG